jgi:hypothetical protein
VPRASSSRLYLIFDQVLVLSRGRQLYFGKGGLTPAEHFAERHGLPSQAGYNTADHLLDIASSPKGSFFESGHSQTSLRTATPGGGNAGKDGHRIDFGNDMDGIRQKYRVGGFKARLDELRQPPKLVSTFLTQLQVLCWREWKNLKRFDWRYSNYNYTDKLPLQR